MRRHIILVVLLILCGSAEFAHAQTQEYPQPQVITPKRATELNGGPALVSIHLKGASPQQFYEQLWKQVDLPSYSHFEFSKNGRPLVTMNYDKAPFWQVVRRFENESGYSLSYDLYPTKTEFGNVGITGQPSWSDVFLTTIDSITRQQKTEIFPSPGKSSVQRESQLKFHINFFSDPKVIIDRYNAKLFLEKVVTEKGESLINYDGFFMGTYNSGWYVFGDDTPLEAINLKGKTIATLKGKMQAPVVVGTQVWKVENIGASGNITFGTAPKISGGNSWDFNYAGLYELKNIHEKDGAYQLDLHFQVPRRPGDGYRYGTGSYNFLLADLHFIDAHGNDIPFGESSQNDQYPEPDIWDSTSHLTLAPSEGEKNDGPISMKWRIPTKLAIIEIPFEFHNLTIPSL
ncbi:MAG: hypothetical protein ABI210_05240 [Abditibacteriaceae bacterium]